MTELQKDSIILDDESEKKVVRMVLKLLEDKNGEVQNLAVKCLGPLVNKVKENQVETIVDSLCGNMMSNVEQLRDISSIGLKTVIAELPQFVFEQITHISYNLAHTGNGAFLNFLINVSHFQFLQGARINLTDKWRHIEV